MIPEEQAKIQEIIEFCLKRYSYAASDECVQAMAAEIYEEFKEDFELAWQYRELCD